MNQLAQDRDKLEAVVSTVMNIWLHKMMGICRLAEELSALDCAQ